MVPGMTERERLAADVRRAEWLAEAMLEPELASRAPGPQQAQQVRPLSRFLAAAAARVRRLGLLRPKLTVRRAAATGR